LIDFDRLCCQDCQEHRAAQRRLVENGGVVQWTSQKNAPLIKWERQFVYIENSGNANNSLFSIENTGKYKLKYL